MSNHTRARGFSLVELLVTLAVLGLLAAIVVPQLMDALHRSRQRRTMAEMRALATANSAHRIDTGAYATARADLEPLYMVEVPVVDAWGNSWTYSLSNDVYTLTSRGSDGAPGPAPPTPWINAPYEPDLILTNGNFSQAPSGQ